MIVGQQVVGVSGNGRKRCTQIMGNGSDEAIDLVFRAFCEPGRDNVVAIDPTYGMYQVCADVNDEMICFGLI